MFTKPTVAGKIVDFLYVALIDIRVLVWYKTFVLQIAINIISCNLLPTFVATNIHMYEGGPLCAGNEKKLLVKLCLFRRKFQKTVWLKSASRCGNI